MVNWKSHANTEINFSPGTNLLIGTMGSGKTSCLEAICFAFFGSFPSLKSRQVSLGDVVMSLPEKKTNALVEVVFTAGSKSYVVTRSVSAKGTEAFLRCEGALFEGPQPIRTTEAVSRLLKINYDTFTRVVYGEQNKIDYLLTLAKGARKSQVDDLLGISLFEKARASSSTLVSKFRSEKTSLETFLAGVEVESLEKELSQLRTSLQTAIEKKNSLESSAFALFNDFETTKKNLESLEELKEINEELSLQLVKTQTEADSLHSSAVSLMPSTFSSLSREQCTSLLEEYARALQERSDLERETNALFTSIQRLEGEAGVIRSILESLSLEKIEEEIKRLSGYSQQLELANKEYMGLAKKEGALRSTFGSLEAELAAISKQEESLLSRTKPLTELQSRFSSIQQLEQELKQMRSGLSMLEKSAASKQEMLSSLQKIVSLLQREGHKCPTCEQVMGEKELADLTQLKKNELEKTGAELASTQSSLEESLKSVSLLDSHLSRWLELLPFASKLQDCQERKSALAASLQRTTGELESVSQLVSASSNNVSHLRAQVEQFEVLKDKKTQAEKSADKLEQLDKQLSSLKSELSKKNTALSTLEERKKMDERLNEARSALKAFDLFEKTEELKKKSRELRDKLSNLQFSESDLKTLREKTSAIATKHESTRVSLEYLSAEVKEKREIVSKLESQVAKLGGVKKSCSDLAAYAEQLSIFQTSLVETQNELRNELITAVNEAVHEVWQSVYPYRDYSSCRVVPTEDDYLLEVRSGGEWRPIEQCSGGEKTCAALALRVSLAMVLVPNLSWIVLDEPTHNLDSQAVNLLARALHDTLPSIVRQTFVVTHDEALKEGASGSIHVFQRDKDSASPSVVETLS